ncbi:MAG: class I SAM-dependent methyltransferase [Thermoleophilia bacterium]
MQISFLPEDLEQYYGPGYYSFDNEWTSVYKHAFKRTIARHRNMFAVTGSGVPGRLFYAIWPRLPLTCLRNVDLCKGSRILDVGCGAGSVLTALKEAGFENVHGIDPYIENDIRYPNGLRIEKKTIEEVSGVWDLVMFNHSLEHIWDQLATLQKAADLMAPNGACMVRTPTVTSYAWEYYGPAWAQIDAPRHLYIHSRESIARAASKVGLNVIDTVYDSSAFQFWGSEQYRKGVALTSPRSYLLNPRQSAFTRKDIRRYKKESSRLNAAGRGDQAAFFLAKL